MNLEGRRLGSSSALEVSTFEMEFRTPERIAEPNVPKRKRIRKCPTNDVERCLSGVEG